ncbi:DUF4405 domain-containing protein [Dehalobacter sp. DCM]|uniref:DUF4405 domain-containing protein n=1 Tax=Dehalobacter sp. DCM TaxID=2907827 RepID=UPI003081C8AA|nr:DUF4405 domain-containing protein [Dehalobacter sp. DCM]
MTHKNIIKMTLDVLMVIVFVFFFNKKVFTGLSFHEIAGLAIGLTFIIHNLINWRWIKIVSTHFFQKKIPLRTKLTYVVDGLLLITMSYIIVSGLLISKYLFPDFRYGSEFFFKNTHVAVSYISLLLLGIHIGLHWHWVMTMVKKLFHIHSNRKDLNYIAYLMVIAVLVIGITSVIQTNYFSQVARIGTTFSQNQITGLDSDAHDFGTDGNLPSEVQNRMPEKGGGPASFQKKGNGTHGGVNTSPLSTVYTLIVYLAIIALFSAITFYTDKLLSAKKVRYR